MLIFFTSHGGNMYYTSSHLFREPRETWAFESNQSSNQVRPIQKKDSIVMENLVSESIKTKAKIVTKDEKENGIRAILNLGHTFGHAIEAFKKYKGITHGQAVIYGIQIIARISYLEGLIDESKYKDLDNTIHSLKLDTDFQKFKYQDLKKFIMNDKKQSTFIAIFTVIILISFQIIFYFFGIKYKYIGMNGVEELYHFILNKLVDSNKTDYKK